MQRVERQKIENFDTLAEVDEVVLQSEVFDAWRTNEISWFDRTGTHTPQAVHLFRDFYAEHEAQEEIAPVQRMAIVFGLCVGCWATIGYLATWLAP